MEPQTGEKEPADGDAVRQLKERWHKFPEDKKDEWGEKFEEDKRAPRRLQKFLIEETGVLLEGYPLSGFCFWVRTQHGRRLRQKRMLENESLIQKKHPDWTLDQIRDEVLRRAYSETLANDNFTLGMQVIRTHITIKRFLLDLEKFKFDAVALCRTELPALKAIEASKGLTEAQKTQRWIEKLFGKPPAALPPSTVTKEDLSE
jgi:hypothetical protein